MNKEVIKIIAENLDHIINIYKGVKDKDRKEIEDHIRKTISDIRQSENMPSKTCQQVLEKLSKEKG